VVERVPVLAEDAVFETALEGRKGVATVRFGLNKDEHQHRLENGWGAETRYARLNLLSQEPISERRLGVPIIPILTTATAMSWRQGQGFISRFAGLSPRHIELSSMPRDRELAAWEYEWFGIGLSVGDEQLVPAAPLAAERYTVVSWQFAECVYASWLNEVRALSPAFSAIQ
jgi:hypothetical protein